MLVFFNFMAGLALMLYGIRVLREGAERLLGARLRKLLRMAVKGRWRAFLAGLAVSVLTPNSTAVTLLSIEAIQAGYVTGAQVLALMLGANIGFTVTVQLLAFRFYLFNAVFIALGVPLFLFSRRQQWRGAGRLLLGVGLLLLAIQTLSMTVAPLKEHRDVQQMVSLLENYPVLVLLFSILLKLVLQSATATIGIAVALAGQGVLPVSAAVVVVIGVNIGIGLTALIAGFRQTETRRMAVGNLVFKLAGAVVGLLWLEWVVKALWMVSPSGKAQLVANAHTMFNVAVACVFLPLVPLIGRFLERLVPASGGGEGRFAPLYLEPSALASPGLALGQATREILHMADHVRKMLDDVHQAFQDHDESLCRRVQERDDKVDLLNSEIKGFLTKLSEQALHAEGSHREVALLSFANDLETIGDLADKNLSELARKKIALKVEFSQEGRVELEEMFQKVLSNFDIAVAAFAGQDRVLAAQLVRHKQFLSEMERDLRHRHFHRLHAGLIESFETSAIHLDVLTYLQHINSHLTSVAYSILEANRR